jgi:hypothetical protein
LRVLLVTLMLAALVACGEERENRLSSERPSAPSEEDAVIRVVDAEKSRESSSGESAPRAELKLQLRFERDAVGLGEPVPARLVLTNTGKRSVRIYDPERGLTADLEYLVWTPDGREVVIRQHREIPEESVRQEDLVVLGPAGEAVVEVDLQPTLLAAGDGAVGEYRVQATFSGGHQGRLITMDLWNRSGSKRLTAREASVRLTWPTDLAGLGITQELDAEVERLLSTVGAERRLTVGAKAALSALGDRIDTLLVRKLALTASRDRKRQLVGWSTWDYLRAKGEAVLEDLRASPKREEPGVRMLRRQIAADAAEAAGEPLSPPDEGIRRTLLDDRARHRLGLTVRWDDAGRGGYEILTLRGSGEIHHERVRGGSRRHEVGELEPAAVRGILETLAEERIWMMEAVRRFTLPGEGFIRLDLVLSPAGARGPERVLCRLDVPENEATIQNRALARVMSRLDSVRDRVSR